jgi:hypothetical protein
MIVRRICATDISWACEIILEPHEWPPPITEDDEFIYRPIRKWVYDHCLAGVFFAVSGLILFESEEDAMLFRMTWG